MRPLLLNPEQSLQVAGTYGSKSIVVHVIQVEVVKLRRHWGLRECRAEKDAFATDSLQKTSDAIEQNEPRYLYVSIRQAL